MVLAKSKNAVGLGNSLMNDRFGKGKGGDRKKSTAQGIQRINHATGETVSSDCTNGRPCTYTL
jgi:large subunit GTPase 1